MKTQKRLILMISLSFWVSITYAGEPIKMGYFQLPPHQYYNEEDPDHPRGPQFSILKPQQPSWENK